MSSYIEAYQARLQRNQEDLIQLIKEVQKKDNSIEAYVHNANYRIINGVVFIKDERINSIHFHEVPYRWSGCGYDEFSKSHYGLENAKMPFSVDDVLNNFKNIKSIRKSQVEMFKNKKHYLEWCSYLTLYKNES